MRSEEDLATGRKILVVLEPFLSGLALSSLSSRTIVRHFDNAFLLGGVIIDEVNLDPELRALARLQLVLRFVDEEGGPFCSHISGEAGYRAYDSTCRRLYRYLNRQNLS